MYAGEWIGWNELTAGQKRLYVASQAPSPWPEGLTWANSLVNYEGPGVKALLDKVKFGRAGAEGEWELSCTNRQAWPEHSGARGQPGPARPQPGQDVSGAVKQMREYAVACERAVRRLWKAWQADLTSLQKARLGKGGFLKFGELRPDQQRILQDWLLFEKRGEAARQLLRAFQARPAAEPGDEAALRRTLFRMDRKGGMGVRGGPP